MSSKIKPSDKYIPLYFVAFFVVLFIADGIFVYLATSTHRGLVTDQAYQKGLDYNKTIAKAQEQEELGWQGGISLKGEQIFFKLRDASNKPILGADVTAHFSRPIEQDKHFAVQLNMLDKGQYSANISFPNQGQWDVKVSALWNKQHYQAHKRIIIE